MLSELHRVPYFGLVGTEDPYSFCEGGVGLHLMFKWPNFKLLFIWHGGFCLRWTRIRKHNRLSGCPRLVTSLPSTGLSPGALGLFGIVFVILLFYFFCFFMVRNNKNIFNEVALKKNFFKKKKNVSSILFNKTCL